MKSITDRYWNEPPKFLPNENHLHLARQFRVEPEIIQILENRGVTSKESIRRYLYPSLHDLEDPFSMKDMEAACSIVFDAVRNKNDLIIWGDYDVDGVTSTCLLLRFFHSIGVYPKWFIPNRFTDGYGLESDNLKRLLKTCENNRPVLITVDCGITNSVEVTEAKAYGCRVIITDHHEPGEQQIEADAVLNVKQKDCSFKDKNIAGVGVAFYLAVGIRAYLVKKLHFKEESPAPNLKKLLELVAIGTISDMVPLKNCNRILVRAGFEVINTSPSPGLAALLVESDIKNQYITSDDIAFQVGPKINAAGRLDSASQAVKLLLETDGTEARKLAKKITSLNVARKKLCADSLEHTLSMARNELLYCDNCIVMKVEYSIGILGIVASQLTEKLRVPVILVAENNDRNHGKVLKGSCRSVSGVDIFEILSRCEKHLKKYGGHKMAAGLTLSEGELVGFKRAFSQCLKEKIENIPPRKGKIDIELDVEKSLDSEFTEQLQLLEPFGVGNPKPVFINFNSILTDVKRIGKKGDHIVFKKRGRFVNHKGIAFNFGEFEGRIKNSPDFGMIYTVMISTFKQAVKRQAKLVDLIE
jgi:single-stranded-DNA-specific exonuclease